MKLDSLEIPATWPKSINTDAPEPGDVIEQVYTPDVEGEAFIFDVVRRVRVRYVLVTVEADGDPIGQVIDRIEDISSVLEAEELVK